MLIASRMASVRLVQTLSTIAVEGRGISRKTALFMKPETQHFLHILPSTQSSTQRKVPLQRNQAKQQLSNQPVEVDKKLPRARLPKNIRGAKGEK